MNHVVERFVQIVAIGVGITVLALTVHNSPTFNIHTRVVTKAAESEKGVIMVLTERGNSAAQAAYLLLAQTRQFQGYAPLLLAIEQDKIHEYKMALGLADNGLANNDLPAVIYFNKSGREVARRLPPPSNPLRQHDTRLQLAF